MFWIDSICPSDLSCLLASEKSNELVRPVLTTPIFDGVRRAGFSAHARNAGHFGYLLAGGDGGGHLVAAAGREKQAGKS